MHICKKWKDVTVASYTVFQDCVDETIRYFLVEKTY